MGHLEGVVSQISSFQAVKSQAGRHADGQTDKRTGRQTPPQAQAQGRADVERFSVTPSVYMHSAVYCFVCVRTLCVHLRMCSHPRAHEANRAQILLEAIKGLWWQREDKRLGGIPSASISWTVRRHRRHCCCSVLRAARCHLDSPPGTPANSTAEFTGKRKLFSCLVKVKVKGESEGEDEDEGEDVGQDEVEDEGEGEGGGKDEDKGEGEGVDECECGDEDEDEGAGADEDEGEGEGEYKVEEEEEGKD